MTIMSNTGTHFMKLCEWIPIDYLDWEELSKNPNAIQLLEKNLDKVDWSFYTHPTLYILNILVGYLLNM